MDTRQSQGMCAKERTRPEPHVWLIPNFLQLKEQDANTDLAALIATFWKCWLSNANCYLDKPRHGIWNICNRYLQCSQDGHNASDHAIWHWPSCISNSLCSLLIDSLKYDLDNWQLHNREFIVSEKLVTEQDGRLREISSGLGRIGYERVK